MIRRHPNGPIKITVKSRSEMESELDHAVQALRHLAEQLKDRGILVSRHSVSDFTVELHTAVPYGLTREHQTW